MIHIGTSGWTHSSLHQKGVFYPTHLSSSEQRLRFYAETFKTVEVASTFFKIPNSQVTTLWAQRTTRDFSFHFQAPAMLTGYPVSTQNIPRIIARELDRDLLKSKMITAFPGEVVEMAFDMFVAALRPLHETGRLGAIVFRFPPWVEEGSQAYSYLDLIREKTHGLDVAMEFAHSSWIKKPGMVTAMAFLKERQMAFVASDTSKIPGGQGPGGLTASFAYIRFSGRKQSVRFLYNQNQLRPWVHRILKAETKVQDVYALFASPYGVDAVSNARLFTTMIAWEKGKKLSSSLTNQAEAMV